ncbi:MAG TPA: protein-disulfide reductase DsbD domain-containing protein [Flavitalea sp.]|nr:protein-disulfide reductase DsbD domain-containing protein [Flavitalea sp.]
MNRLLLILTSFLLGSSAFAQSDVVEWKFESRKLAEKKYEVKLIAVVKKPWHIYSTTTPDGGPLPTKINFTKNPLTAFDGKIKEVGKLETHFEEVFDVDTKFFNNKVEFVQVVNVKGNAKTNLAGTVEFMACNDKECLPPKSVAFSVALK